MYNCSFEIHNVKTGHTVLLFVETCILLSIVGPWSWFSKTVVRTTENVLGNLHLLSRSYLLLSPLCQCRASLTAELWLRRKEMGQGRTYLSSYCSAASAIWVTTSGEPNTSISSGWQICWMRRPARRPQVESMWFNIEKCTQGK